jgi:cytochrome c556
MSRASDQLMLRSLLRRNVSGASPPYTLSAEFGKSFTIWGWISILSCLIPTAGKPRSAPIDMRTVIRCVVMTLAVAALPAPRAQQSGSAPAPRTLIPVTTSTLAGDPEPLYGEHVTMMGVVEQTYSRSVFSVDQDGTRSTGRDVLIIAPRLTRNLDRNSYVTVIGEVLRFDPSEIAKRANDYTLDLVPDIVEKFRGRPAVFATAVINAALIDLAKRLPPPMTPEEEAFSKVMKRVGPAFNALRQAVSGSDAAAARENTVQLKQAFVETEAFWKTRAKLDAIKWAREARDHVDALALAVSRGQWDEVKTASTSLGQACQSCHGMYRERFDDGTFRIKSGTK